MLRTPLLLHPSTTSTSLFACRRTPAAGIASFATTDIPQSTVILTEAPLLTTGADPDYEMTVYDRWLALSPSLKSNFAELVTTRDRIRGVKRTLKELATETGPLKKRAQMIMAEEGGMKEFASVVATMFNNDWEVPPEYLEYTNGDWRALFLAAARFNHSCWPNVMTEYGVTKDGGVALSFVTVRPIKKGEELLVSYLDNEMGFAERQDKLAHYGFACACPFCELERHLKETLMTATTAAQKLRRVKTSQAVGALREWYSGPMIYTDEKNQVDEYLTKGRKKRDIVKCHERGIVALRKRKNMNRKAGTRMEKRDEQNLEALRHSLGHVLGLPWPA
ncbi:SET domain-containing protein [Saccharata proteae CBS 121410]|uniref:SET domain-containing protein n=1 Tax=Saccharata proteae CBS 121410 TaxID=1314787 RepID=A0A9P4HV09_9PEZI|nr:SET domain-containing protein [Saccharata proteae CBS 121410]